MSVLELIQDILASSSSPEISPGSPEVSPPLPHSVPMVLASLAPLAREIVENASEQAPESVRLRAIGYGCGKCGNRVYRQVPTGWMCEGCGMVFDLIGKRRKRQ